MEAGEGGMGREGRGGGWGDRGRGRAKDRREGWEGEIGPHNEKLHQDGFTVDMGSVSVRNGLVSVSRNLVSQCDVGLLSECKMNFSSHGLDSDSVPKRPPPQGLSPARLDRPGPVDASRNASSLRIATLRP